MYEFMKILQNRRTLRRVIVRSILIQCKREHSVSFYEFWSEKSDCIKMEQDSSVYKECPDTGYFLAGSRMILKEWCGGGMKRMVDIK